MAVETKQVILTEINEEYSVQIKNIYYSCIYLTYILYQFNKLNLNIFLISYFLKDWVRGSLTGAGYLRKYGTYCQTSLVYTLPSTAIRDQLWFCQSLISSIHGCPFVSTFANHGIWFYVSAVFTCTDRKINGFRTKRSTAARGRAVMASETSF
jgi:hypothetical protein